MESTISRIIKSSLILIVLVLIVFNTASSYAQVSDKSTVVVIYAVWDDRSMGLKSILEQMIGTYNAALVELDIDSPNSMDQMRSYGINIPRNIPKVAVIDRNGSIVFQQVYKIVSLEQLKKDLDQAILK
jgi:hypothetical protein